MNSTTFVRARVDEAVKKEAAFVLADMDLTISDVVRIVLARIANDKALPFELCIPNRLTAETMAKSDQGEDVHCTKGTNDLFKQLGI